MDSAYDCVPFILILCSTVFMSIFSKNLFGFVGGNIVSCWSISGLFWLILCDVYSSIHPFSHCTVFVFLTLLSSSFFMFNSHMCRVLFHCATSCCWFALLDMKLESSNPFDSPWWLLAFHMACAPFILFSTSSCHSAHVYSKLNQLSCLSCLCGGATLILLYYVELCWFRNWSIGVNEHLFGLTDRDHVRLVGGLLLFHTLFSACLAPSYPVSLSKSGHLSSVKSVDSIGSAIDEVSDIDEETKLYSNSSLFNANTVNNNSNHDINSIAGDNSGPIVPSTSEYFQQLNNSNNSRTVEFYCSCGASVTNGLETQASIFSKSTTSENIQRGVNRMNCNCIHSISTVASTIASVFSTTHSLNRFDGHEALNDDIEYSFDRPGDQHGAEGAPPTHTHTPRSLSIPHGVLGSPPASRTKTTLDASKVSSNVIGSFSPHSPSSSALWSHCCSPLATLQPYGDVLQSTLSYRTNGQHADTTDSSSEYPSPRTEEASFVASLYNMLYFSTIPTCDKNTSSVQPPVTPSATKGSGLSTTADGRSNAVLSRGHPPSASASSLLFPHSPGLKRKDSPSINHLYNSSHHGNSTRTYNMTFPFFHVSEMNSCAHHYHNTNTVFTTTSNNCMFGDPDDVCDHTEQDSIRTIDGNGGTDGTPMEEKGVGAISVSTNKLRSHTDAGHHRKSRSFIELGSCRTRPHTDSSVSEPPITEEEAIRLVQISLLSSKAKRAY